MGRASCGLAWIDSGLLVCQWGRQCVPVVVSRDLEIVPELASSCLDAYRSAQLVWGRKCSGNGGGEVRLDSRTRR